MKSPPRHMPVIQPRPWRLPEGAFAIALVEGHVLRGTDRPLEALIHVIAFRAGQFTSMTPVKWPEGFVMQLPAGAYRLVAFEGGREIASADVRASLGVHKVALTPEGSRPDTRLELSIDVEDDGWKN